MNRMNRKNYIKMAQNRDRDGETERERKIRRRIIIIKINTEQRIAKLFFVYILTSVYTYPPNTYLFCLQFVRMSVSVS